MNRAHNPDTITIDGYLVQSKLEAALQQIVGVQNWKGREVNVPGTHRRWDMAYELNNLTTVVEFDGDAHYWNSLKIKVDKEKDQAAYDLGYRAVRIPYWVQLTTETLDFYFGLHAKIQQDFPHGFISTKIFPASFSELGVERFERELLELPPKVNESVRDSLQNQVNTHGIEYVLPSNLRAII